MIYTEYGHISEGVAGYTERELLDRGQMTMITQRFAKGKTMPQNRGQVMHLARYINVNPALSPLAEGITPAGQRIVKENVWVTLRQYGDLAPLTDVIEDTHEDPFLDEAIEIIQEQISETIERLTFNVMKSGTTVFYGGTGTTRATVNGVLTRGICREVVRHFKRNRAKQITSMNKPSANIGTEAVEASFFALCHSDLENDLRNMDNFTNAKDYGSGGALPYEIGACENVRFLTSELFDPYLAAATSATGTTYLSNGDTPTSAASPDVYPIVFIARDSYAAVKLQGKGSVKPTVLNPNTPTPSDPLGQRGCVAWKLWFASVILNQNWLAVAEVACTAKCN